MSLYCYAGLALIIYVYKSSYCLFQLDLLIWYLDIVLAGLLPK